MREEAIRFREQQEHKLLQKMFKTKQVSPRTYEQKRKDLEIWVTKEKDEVKKTRKVFEEQWTKTALIIEQTQKNQDLMKKILGGTDANVKREHDGSLPSENTLNNAMASSQRMGSHRGEQSKLLEMIYDEEKDERKKREEDREERKRREEQE